MTLVVTFFLRNYTFFQISWCGRWEKKVKMPLTVKSKMSSNFTWNNKLSSVISFVEVGYRLYLCLPVANYSAENSFLKLNRVKNEFGFTMKNPRLSALEKSMLKEMYADEITVESPQKRKTIYLKFKINYKR